MKGRNISFAQVLKSKSRSPQPSFQKQPSLFSLFEQFQENPSEDFTLYLSGMRSTARSQSTRTFASRGKQEEMFDSWIQRQSALNSNKENISTQAKKSSAKVNQQTKLDFASRLNSRGFKQTKPNNEIKNQENRQIRQIQLSNQYDNIGNNIRMIKSKTCEKEDIRQVSSPQRNQELNLQVEEVNFKRRITNQEYEPQKQQKKFNQIDQPQMEQPHQEYDVNQEQNINHKEEQLQELVEQTNNIHYEIASLAQKYVTKDDMLQSQQSNLEQDDDELLIGNSGRKLLLTEENAFGEQYEEKARKEEEIQRKRRQEAKMKLNGLIQEYNNRPKTDFNLPKFESISDKPDCHIKQHFEHSEEHSGVGYSFATNPIYASKDQEIKKVNNPISPPQSLSSSNQIMIAPDNDFRNYVNAKQNDGDETKTIEYQCFQTRRSMNEDVGVVNIPNQSFQVKLIQNEENSNYINSPVQETNVQQPEPLNTTNQSVSHPGIKLSLIEKSSTIKSKDNDLQGSISIGIRKSKGISNQKLKVYSNSNKSSPHGSQSSKRNNSNNLVDVKTQPFIINHPIQKSIIEQKDQLVPFATISQNVQSTKYTISYSQNPQETVSSFEQKHISNIKNSSQYYSQPIPSQMTSENNISNTLNFKQSFTKQSFSDKNEGNEPTYGKTKTSPSSSFQAYKEKFHFTKTEFHRGNNSNTNGHTLGKVETKIIYDPPTYETKKQGRKSLLNDLDLKESINMDEPNHYEIKKQLKHEVMPEVKGLLSRQLKQSLKQSIDLKTSTEFTFDF